MESYPSHVVVAWIGHSETVARKHYLQVTDANFERATSKVLAPQAAPQLCGVIETEENTESAKNEKTVVFTAFSAEFASLPEEQITRPGLEPGTTEPKSVVLPLHHRVTLTSPASIVAKTDADFAEFEADFIQ